jgi:hypothetical protein
VRRDAHAHRVAALGDDDPRNHVARSQIGMPARRVPRRRIDALGHVLGDGRASLGGGRARAARRSAPGSRSPAGAGSSVVSTSSPSR